MTARKRSFLEWLIDRLYRSGTRRLFGVPGGGTSLDLIDAASRQGMEMVLTAREDAAVIMAGVSGILTEAPGIASTTKGPGLSSAANGLASASLDRMPALLISETFGPGELDYITHQVYDQTALTAPLLQDGRGDILDATAEAVEAWLVQSSKQYRQPAVMFPTGGEFRAPVNVANEPAQPVKASIDDSDLARASEMLAESENPVFIVGLEAARPSLAHSVVELVEVLNSPVLSTYMASGTVPTNHPNYAGIFTGGAIEQACVNEADLITLIGLDPIELIRKPWSYDAPVLDLCETEHHPHYLVPEHRLCAPLDQSLPAILDASAEAAGTWTEDRIRTHRARFYEGLRTSAEGGLSSGNVVDAAVSAFEGKPRLAVDAGAHMFSACAFWPAMEPRDVLISNGLATMGFAVPAAIAAALHEPERGAVAMTGDGGILMCLGELRTATETNSNICIIVFNDGQLSLIDIKREERQMPDLGLSWNRPDFAAVARGFGFQAWRPETPEQLEKACDEAASLSSPRLIDAQIDPSGYLVQMRSLRG